MNQKMINPKNAALRSWYYAFSRDQDLHTRIREAIMERCYISQATFYHWITGRVVVPDMAIEHIRQAALSNQVDPPMIFPENKTEKIS